MSKRRIHAKIVADSLSPQGHRITSYILTYPRFIHPELMTHRMFSRNSASSRAMPFQKMIDLVTEDPFIPIAWQKDHKGMQGTEYFMEQWQVDYLIGKWLEARDNAAQIASYLNEGISKITTISGMRDFEATLLPDTGLTKQLCNRLLEPFVWHTVLVTATEYDNFFELRCPKYRRPDGNKTYRSRKECLGELFKNSILSEEEWWKLSESGAEIHIQALAEAMWDAKNESTPKQLEPGEWHIPFGDQIFTSNLVNNYQTTREEDLDFHRHRTMFIVKDNKLIIAPQGTSQSHTEYFGDITGLVRGFRWNDEVYTYKNGFIPVESDVVANYFSELTLYAGGKDFFHYKYGENPNIKIAVARCARLSYMTFEGEIDYAKDIALHDILLKSKHMSPFEHVARAMNDLEYYSFIKGEVPTTSDEDGILNYEYYCFSKGFEDKDGYKWIDFEGPNPNNGNRYGWCNNFKGFIPYRYLIEK